MYPSVSTQLPSSSVVPRADDRHLKGWMSSGHCGVDTAVKCAVIGTVGRYAPSMCLQLHTALHAHNWRRIIVHVHHTHQGLSDARLHHVHHVGLGVQHPGSLLHCITVGGCVGGGAVGQQLRGRAVGGPLLSHDRPRRRRRRGQGRLLPGDPPGRPGPGPASRSAL